MGAKFRSTVTVNDQTFDQITQVDSLTNWITTLALPKASTGTLSTRTSNTVGVLTLAAGHGIQNGDKIGLYNSGGWIANANVTGVSTNLISITTITGGYTLPVLNSAIIAGKIVTTACVISTDDVKAFSVAHTSSGRATIRNNTDELYNKIFATAGIFAWYTGADYASNLTSGENADTFEASTSSTTNDQTVRLAILRD